MIRVKYYFIICIALIASCKVYSKRNALLKKERVVDYKILTKWDNNILSKIKNDESWKKFDNFNIENAIKYVPDQGPYGSCTVNSSARAMTLMNFIVINYSEFLKKAKIYASATISYQTNLVKKIPKEKFKSLLKFQDDLNKDDNQVSENLLKEYYKKGSSFFQIAKFINNHGKYVIAKNKRFNNFENCVELIRLSIDKKLSIIGSFKGGKRSSGNPIYHAMNIIGYKISKYHKFKISQFLILNTRKSKIIGSICFEEMQMCMNKDGYYDLLVFYEKH